MADRYWVGGTGTWNATTTNWAASSGGASGASAPTSADNVFFDVNSNTGTGAFTVTVGAAASCLNFLASGLDGTMTFAGTSTLNVYGNFTLPASNFTRTFTGQINFSATATGKTITCASKTFASIVVFNGAGGGWQLQDTFTTSSTMTVTQGALDLNNNTLISTTFTSTGSSTRSIAFGTTGAITVTSTGTVFNMTTVTGFTSTGTSTVNVTNAGATAITVISGALSEANALSFNFTGGTYALTFLGTAGYTAKTVNFTGYTGAWQAIAGNTIYGGLTLTSGMSFAGAPATLTFGATSGTYGITTNTKAIPLPITFDGVGGTWQLQDNSTVQSDVTLTNGTLDINSKTFTCNTFSSSNANTRTIAFGTGNITVNTTGTLWTTTTVTGLTVTGTPVVNVTTAGSTAITVLSGPLSEANAISFNFSAGTYALTFLGTAGETAGNVNFTGYAGTLGAIGGNTIYGNLTVSTGMTLTTSANALTFGATSGTKTITTSAKTFFSPITINGAGGTFQLQDALTMGGTRAFTHTNGTFDLNGKTLTVGTRYETATGTKNLTFNAGTLVCPASGTIAFYNLVPTGFTTTAGTGTGKISMTSTSAKTFVGNGSTFNCTLSNDGAGALTISGSNTFTTLANGVQPTTVIFGSTTTQTVTNFNLAGTVGNQVTFNAATPGSAATLSVASGTINANYLSIQDINASGGAYYNAYTGAGNASSAGNVNVSNNNNWHFIPAGMSFASFFT